MERLYIEDGELLYEANFLALSESLGLYEHLLENIDWRKDRIKIFGKEYDVPRLQAWYGDPDAKYSYSNIDLNPLPWTPDLMKLKHKVEQISEGSYNSVLLNLYRNGQDSNGWHSDNEKELGSEPEIASVTLGQARTFHLKHKSKKLKQSLILENGSLLIMKGKTQQFWKHQVPKSAKPLEPRINLTFRRIFT